MSDSVYAVIGSGKQGTAEGYDLVRFGRAGKLIMADRDLECARQAAHRINTLTGTTAATAHGVDASSETALTRLLMEHGVTTCCGAAHYALNLTMTRAAIAAGAHFCDMGGNTGVVHNQHKLHDAARDKGVAVVPDCGIAPGTANVLAARAIGTIQCDSIRMFCGGLPQNRDLPLGYRTVFSISGLTNEYTGMCIEIRNGKIVEVPAFTEKEELELPDPVGRCEAFLTSGGTSTGPWSFQGKVKHYGYKTLRYPGHYNAVRTMIDMGFLDENPMNISGKSVIPREVFHSLAERFWDCPDEPDLLVLQVRARGRDPRGEPVEMIQNLMDFQDPETGMTAMERTTAYSAAIVAGMLERGDIAPGVQPLELSVDPARMVEALQQRDIHIETTIQAVS